jgi:hypothetical protein
MNRRLLVQGPEVCGRTLACSTQPFDGFLAANVDMVPHSWLHAALGDVVQHVDPTHCLVFESALVASRPGGDGRLRAVDANDAM